MTPSETLEILREKGLRQPRTLTLAITGACNLECLHCWVDSGMPSSATHVPEQTLRRLVKEFAELGGERVRFTGGEPLCHPGWLDLVRYARSIGLRGISLQTNGILLTDGHVTALRNLDFPELSIQISLDGATAPTHDLVRGAGAFRSVLDGIRRLTEGGLGRHITVFCTEMRHNLDEIPALLQLADGMGIGSVVTGSLVLGGRAAEGSLVAPPAPDQYLRLLDRYDTDPRFRENYGRIGNVAPLQWQSDCSVREEACTFVENPYLTPDGRLYPCVLCHTDDFAVSGVLGKSLAEAFAEGASRWVSLLQISRCRAAVLAECRECPGRHACAGGCMGRAWGSCGDLMAADDRCGLRRSVYQRKDSPPSAVLPYQLPSNPSITADNILETKIA